MQASPANQRVTNKNHRRQQAISEEALSPVQEIVEIARDYARTNPEAAALWCFGIGFVLGWKLKPW